MYRSFWETEKEFLGGATPSDKTRRQRRFWERGAWICLDLCNWISSSGDLGKLDCLESQTR